MKPLYTENEFCQAKGTDLLPFECCSCGVTFCRTKTEINRSIKTARLIKYCSKKCHNNGLYTSITDNCGYCSNKCVRVLSQQKKSKSKKIFCNGSCAAKYNNTHKTTGCRRSKIEIWIEQQLKELYPTLNILFNDKSIINSELDIYIPSFSLAFELNGIFHYEPIFGQNKLNQIQSNDQNKFYLCQKNEINLCVIDISYIKKFKIDKAQKILDIICDIIYQYN